MHDTVRTNERYKHTLHVRPDPPVTPAPPGGCPVNILARQTLASARSLTRMLRRLRISMTNCSACPSRSNCPILKYFNAQLSLALQEVADEWQLT
jgi:hypothetical protein